MNDLVQYFLSRVTETGRTVLSHTLTQVVVAWTPLPTWLLTIKTDDNLDSTQYYLVDDTNA